MKFLPNLLFLFLFSCAFLQTSAQTHADEIIDWTVRTSDFIFEGKVTRTEAFLSLDQNHIYTRHTIEVSKVIKGSVPYTVEVITQGGVMEDGRFQIISHTTTPSAGTEGLFFCKTYSNTNISQSPYLMLQGSDGLIEYTNNSAQYSAASRHKQYNNIYKDLYLMLEEKYGFTIESVQPNTIEKHFMCILGENLSSRSSGGEALLEFRFDNIIIQGIESVKLDIMVRTNKEDLQLGDSEVFFDYTPKAFGSNVISSGKTQVTAGKLLSDASITPTVVDEDENTIKISIPSDCFKSAPSSFMSLTQSFEQLLQFEIGIKDITAISSLELDAFSMEGNVNYFDPELGYCVLVDTLIVPTPVNVLSSAKVISFYPNPITAGTGDTLFIVGDSLGTIKGTVRFPSADSGGSQMMTANSEDVVWSDTLIKVRMPSTEGAGGGNPAGSGIFEIETATAMKAKSTTPLEVRYAVLNIRSVSSEPIRMQLTDDINGDGTLDSLLTFRLDTNIISANPMALQLVKDAMCEWSNATGIQWELGAPLSTLPAPSNTNFIIFASNTLFQGQQINATAFTRISGIGNCSDNSQTPSARISYVGSPDIYLRQNLASVGATGWHYSSTMPPTGKTMDFYSVLLHELGHAHLLKHAIPDTKVMYWQVKEDSIRRNISIDDLDGGIDILTTSKTVLEDTLTSGCIQAIPLGNGCRITSISEVLPVGNTTIYPNPAETDVAVALEDYIGGDTKILIFNSIGQQVISRDLGYLPAGSHSVEIPIDILPIGIYYITLEQRQLFHLGKLLKL